MAQNGKRLRGVDSFLRHCITFFLHICDNNQTWLSPHCSHTHKQKIYSQINVHFLDINRLSGCKQDAKKPHSDYFICLLSCQLICTLVHLLSTSMFISENQVTSLQSHHSNQSDVSDFCNPNEQKCFWQFLEKVNEQSLFRTTSLSFTAMTVPPEAYGHRSCNKRSCKPPQREDGDDDCPHQHHLVVLQLDVPSLQESLIDKSLNKLQRERRQRSTFSI